MKNKAPAIGLAITLSLIVVVLIIDEVLIEKQRDKIIELEKTIDLYEDCIYNDTTSRQYIGEHTFIINRP